jgi:hypothetical protein
MLSKLKRLNGDEFKKLELLINSNEYWFWLGLPSQRHKYLSQALKAKMSACIKALKDCMAGILHTTYTCP